MTNRRADASSRLNEILMKLKGKQCWRCSAMVVTGTAISLNFGNRIPWAAIGNRENIEDVFGEFGLMIEGAAWRVLRENQAVMTSDTIMTDERAVELCVFEGKSVIAASVCSLTLDLTIAFEMGLRLDVFCNCFDETLCNYTISQGHSYYSARARNRVLLVCEELDEAESSQGT